MTPWAMCLFDFTARTLHKLNGFYEELPTAERFFKGVYARDQIKLVSYPSAYVIISDLSRRRGKHWIAVFFERSRNGQYFDSSGLPSQVVEFFCSDYILQCVINIVFMLSYLDVVVYFTRYNLSLFA